MLMECLSVLLSGLDSNSLVAVLSEDVKDRAKGFIPQPPMGRKTLTSWECGGHVSC